MFEKAGKESQYSLAAPFVSQGRGMGGRDSGLYAKSNMKPKVWIKQHGTLSFNTFVLFGPCT